MLREIGKIKHFLNELVWLLPCTYVWTWEQLPWHCNACFVKEKKRNLDWIFSQVLFSSKIYFVVSIKNISWFTFFSDSSIDIWMIKELAKKQGILTLLLLLICIMSRIVFSTTSQYINNNTQRDFSENWRKRMLRRKSKWVFDIKTKWGFRRLLKGSLNNHS